MQIQFLKGKRFRNIRLVSALFVLTAGLFFVFSKVHLDTVYNKIQDFGNVKSIAFAKGDVLEQSLFFDSNQTIHSIGIAFGNRTIDCRGNIKILFTDNDSILWEGTVRAEYVPLRKIEWFQTGLTVNANEAYTLKILTEDMQGTLYVGAVSVENNSKGTAGTARKNGIESENAILVETTFHTGLHVRTRIVLALWVIVAVIYLLGFETLFYDKTRGILSVFITLNLLVASAYFWVGFQFVASLNYVMFLGLIAMIVIAGAFYVILLLKENGKVELYFLISTFLFGMVYSIILPPFSAPDEDFHFAEAYRLSNAMMGQPVNDEYGYVYMRECDIQNLEHYPNNSYTIDVIKGLIRGDKQLSEDMMPSESYRNTSAPISVYIPQAAGITIGRLLHLNFYRTVYLGRWMNLLTFILITTWAIKLIPNGKYIIYAICQIPLLLEVVSSYSYDMLILSGTFLLIAYVLKLCRQERKISVKQTVGLFILAAVYGPLKPIYIPLVGLVFLIPGKNISTSKIKGIGCKFAILGAAVLASVLVYKFSVLSMFRIENSITAVESEMVYDGSLALEQADLYRVANEDPYNLPNLRFILENPFDLAESFTGAMIMCLDEYILSLFGNYLGWYHIRIPVYISGMAMLLLYFAYRKDDGYSPEIVNVKGRIYALVIMTGTILAPFFAMYLTWSTNPSRKHISGVQGRYLIPALAVLPFFFQGKHTGDKYKKIYIIMISLTIQVLTIMSVSMTIWNE